MKKLNFIFFIAVYLLASCAAPPLQVTFTSEVTVTLTPAPTPTQHPKFAALQQAIADSGSRFTLQADGLVYDGETPIPGVTVAPDGTMSMTVNGETVTLDPADVNFDDQDGISIDGYDFQDTDGDGNPDSWVEVESPAMVQTNKLIETYKLDKAIEDGKITVTEEGGAVNVTDNETGTVLIRTIGENSKFDLGFAVNTIAAKSCEPKPEFVPSSRGLMLAENFTAANEYFMKVREELDFKPKIGSHFWRVLIDREHRCWGEILNDGTDLIYRDADGVAQWVSLIGLSKAEIEDFISNR
ncbi:MAG: hypothetical protein L6Q49_20245 [Anaerolineales bacterium]|nr:hypothetical protein [Anaerolineales bacterium]